MRRGGRRQMVLSQWDAGLAGPGNTRGPLCPAKTRPPLKPLFSVGCTHRGEKWLDGASPPLSHPSWAGNGAEIRRDLFFIWYVWDRDKAMEGQVWGQDSVKRPGDSRPRVSPTCTPPPQTLSLVGAKNISGVIGNHILLTITLTLSRSDQWLPAETLLALNW